jgi:hypothetical protein
MRLKSFARALALVPGSLAAQASTIKPVCSADRVGERLLTTAQFPNGYRVDGPWIVVNQKGGASSRSPVAMTAVLDRIVEFDPAQEKRSITPFPTAIEIVFKGDTEADVLDAAALVWCQTVSKARGGNPDTRVAATFRVSAAPTVPKPRA